MPKENIRLFGFTLAEILIALGINGVVAAITIPALNNSIQDMKHKSALKKFYSTLEQAQAFVNSSEIGGFDDNPFGAGTNNPNLYKLSKYIKFQKICWNVFSSDPPDIVPTPGHTTAAAEGCWYDDTKATALGLLQYYAADDGYAASAIMANGMLLGIGDSTMYVDTNGFKGPNAPGKDVFVFQYDISKKKFLPLDAFGTNTKTQLENF